MAAHVGCAKWRTEKSAVELLKFFPGKDDNPPEIMIYCAKHAKEMKMPTKKKTKDSSKNETKSSKAKIKKKSKTANVLNVDKEKEVIFDSDSDTDDEDDDDETPNEAVKEKTQDSSIEPKEKNSKYFEKKRFLEGQQALIVKDLVSLIENASSNIEFESKKEKRRKWWSE